MNGIQVKNLVKTYTTQSTDIILNGAKRPSTTRTVLHGVSVDFPAGKLTAILGRSGCGKSTLLRLIDGTKDAPDSGEIVMPEGWRCALLSPDPYVITWTSVERNVAMAAGAGRTPEERLELEDMGLKFFSSYSQHLPCHMMESKKLTKMVAIDCTYNENTLDAVRRSAIDVLECCVQPGENYGTDLNYADILRYSDLVEKSGKPCLIPTQRKIKPCEVRHLYEAGCKAVM